MARSITPSQSNSPKGPFLRKDMDFLTGLKAKCGNCKVTKNVTIELDRKFHCQFVGLVNSPNPVILERAKDELAAARDVIGSMPESEAKLRLDHLVNRLERWVYRKESARAPRADR